MNTTAKKNIGQTLQLNAARDQGLSLQTCCEENKYIESWVYLSKIEVWENRSISMIDNCKSCASLVRAKIFAHHWSEWKYCVSRKIASLGTSLHRCASPMQEGKNASPEKSYTNQFEISATERWYNLRPIMKEDIYIYIYYTCIDALRQCKEKNASPENFMLKSLIVPINLRSPRHRDDAICIRDLK